MLMLFSFSVALGLCAPGSQRMAASVLTCPAHLTLLFAPFSSWFCSLNTCNVFPVLSPTKSAERKRGRGRGRGEEACSGPGQGCRCGCPRGQEAPRQARRVGMLVCRGYLFAWGACCCRGSVLLRTCSVDAMDTFCALRLPVVTTTWALQ